MTKGDGYLIAVKNDFLSLLFSSIQSTKKRVTFKDHLKVSVREKRILPFFKHSFEHFLFCPYRNIFCSEAKLEMQQVSGFKIRCYAHYLFHVFRYLMLNQDFFFFLNQICTFCIIFKSRNLNLIIFLFTTDRKHVIMIITLLKYL